MVELEARSKRADFTAPWRNNFGSLLSPENLVVMSTQVDECKSHLKHVQKAALSAREF